MAYWVQETATNGTNNGGCKFYMCDTKADVKKLPKAGVRGEVQETNPNDSDPCSCGSTCLCLEDTSVWVLGKETNEWKEI